MGSDAVWKKRGNLNEKSGEGLGGVCRNGLVGV